MDAVGLCPNHAPLPSSLVERLPLCLWPVAGKPLIEHMIESLARHDVQRIFLVVEDSPFKVEQALGKGEKWGVSLELRLEKSFRGMGESLRKFSSALSSPFLLLPRLSLWDPPWQAVLKEHLDADRETTFVPMEEALAQEEGEGPFGEKADLLQGLCMKREVLGKECPEKTFALGDWKDAFEERDIQAALFAESFSGCVVSDLSGYRRANRLALDGRLPFLRIPGREWAPGDRRGVRCRVHPSARISPPAVLGDGCEISAGASVGPRAVLGEGCVVDRGAQVRHCVVWPFTYMGAETRVRESVVDGNLMVPFSTGQGVYVPDPFILGDSRQKGPGQGFNDAVHRLLALAGLVISSPVLLCLLAYHKLRPGKGFLRKEALLGEEVLEDLRGRRAPRPFTLHTFSARSPLLRYLPSLYDVLRGELNWVGVEPRAPGQANEGDEEWQRPGLQGRPGLVQPWHALEKKEWDPVEKRVMENYYVQTRRTGEDLKILWKALVRFLRG